MISKDGYNIKHFDSNLSDKVFSEINNLLDDVMSNPILLKAGINKRFYLRTDMCAIEHDNIVL